MRQLQSQDQRIDKRQQWLASISGCHGCGSGRCLKLVHAPIRSGPGGAYARGPMAQAAQAQQPRMGLAGMRAPTSRRVPWLLGASAGRQGRQAGQDARRAPAAPVQSPVTSVEPEAGLASNVVPLEPADEVDVESSEAPPP